MKGYFVDVSCDTIREWTDSAGEEWAAASPVLLAIRQELKEEGIDPTLERCKTRRNEYAAFTRQPSERFIQTVLDLDALQRENGYEGDPLARGLNVKFTDRIALSGQ